MPLDTYQLPENHDGFNEDRFTITDRQRRIIDRLARDLPEKVFSLHCRRSREAGPDRHSERVRGRSAHPRIAEWRPGQCDSLSTAGRDSGGPARSQWIQYDRPALSFADRAHIPPPRVGTSRRQWLSKISVVCINALHLQQGNTWEYGR